MEFDSKTRNGKKIKWGRKKGSSRERERRKRVKERKRKGISTEIHVGVLYPNFLALRSHHI